MARDMERKTSVRSSSPVKSLLASGRLALLGFMSAQAFGVPKIPRPDVNHVTVSPATTNKNLEFTRKFHHVFGAVSLLNAFEQHVAFKAVFRAQESALEHNRRMRRSGRFAKTHLCLQSLSSSC